VTGPRLSLIAAVARNGIIGRDNRMPWRLPSDLKRFKALTVGHPVVMGRKTFQSIGKPLPGRDNIVVSRHAFAADGATVAPTLAAAMARADSAAGAGGEVFIIGGAEIYRQAMAMADRLYITEVALDPEGDAAFPAIDPAVWRVTAREKVKQPEGDTAASSLVVYDRVGPRPVDTVG
jgi:dihydrofolate reductase